MSFIEFKNINKSYDGTNLVLKDISLSIEKGELVTLLGPSGCGKSTLLRCLAGFEEIDSGSILIGGKDVALLPPGKRELGMVFQQYSLFPNMTVEENIGFGLKMKKTESQIIAEKVKNMVEIVGLKGREKYFPRDLSGGQKQRVALARAIITEPHVLFLDEPLSAIDAQLRKSLQQSIREIQQSLSITSIFVTHDQDEAMVMSDQIFVMNGGKVEQSGTPVELYTQPKTKFVASFMGNYNVLEAESFRQLTGKETEHTIALRPEVISIYTSDAQIEEDDQYRLTGKVVEKTSKGNILSYRIESNDVVIKADELFRSGNLYEIGESVQFTFEKRNCLIV